MATRGESLLVRSRLPFLRDLVSRKTGSGKPMLALDGLRGLAVLTVVASHTGGLLMVGHGAAGVWLFFVLSAFLLTLPFATDPGRALRPRDVRVYLLRRALRILPTYYVAIGVHAWLLGWNPETTLQHLAFLRARGILWTIPQELLFYLLLPALLLLHPLVFRGRTGLTIAALALLATASNLALDASVFSLHGAGKELPFHLGIFLTGMAFAYARHWAPLEQLVARPGWNRFLGGLGLFLILAFVCSGRHWVSHYVRPLPGLGSIEVNWSNHFPGTFAVFCGLLVYIVSVCRKGLLDRLLSSLLLRALGLVSFSLYLFHYLVRNEGARSIGSLGTELLVWTLGVTYLVSCVSYSLVERPSVALGRLARGTPPDPVHAPPEAAEPATS